jgi:hypothetical protein
MLRVMENSAYRKTLTAARRDLKRLYREREDMDRKIAQLRQTVLSLGALCHEPGRRDFVKEYGLRGGLTNGVFDAIQASQTPLSVRRIQETLEDLGYDFKAKNRAAAIHSVAKRMVEQGKLQPVTKPTKNDRYDVNAQGFWWGDTKPPAPWVRHNWGAYKLPKTPYRVRAGSGSKPKKEGAE